MLGSRCHKIIIVLVIITTTSYCSSSFGFYYDFNASIKFWRLKHHHSFKAAAVNYQQYNTSQVRYLHSVYKHRGAWQLARITEI